VTIERDGSPLLAFARRGPDGGAWWLTHPFEDEADGSAANALVGRIVGLRAETILDDADRGATVGSSAVTITLTGATPAGPAGAEPRPGSNEAPLVLRVGLPVADTPLRFADISDRPPVFELDATALMDELERPAESWRSMLALDVTTWDADQIVMRRGERSITVERVDGEFEVEKKWRLIDPESASFDPAGFDAAIGSLARLDAVRVAHGATAAETGLDDPLASLIVRYPDRPEARLDIGRAAGDGEVYARRAGRPVTLAIAAADAARIDPSVLRQDVPPASATDAPGEGSP